MSDHLKFLSVFGEGFCRAAINSHEQYTRLVWTLTKPLTSSSPPTSLRSLFHEKNAAVLNKSCYYRRDVQTYDARWSEQFQ